MDPTNLPPGYTYGTASASPVSLDELQKLKVTVGFRTEHEVHLKLAGEVLRDQARQIVDHWRSRIIASVPNLARHSRSIDGSPLPHYLARSNQRFEQWIMDTCLRPYDQDWLNYQHEIALRHTTQCKNQVDGVKSTPFVPFRDIVAFSAVMNETIKSYLATKGHLPEEVNDMHQSWCKSIQLQLALWARTFMDFPDASLQW